MFGNEKMAYLAENAAQYVRKAGDVGFDIIIACALALAVYIIAVKRNDMKAVYSALSFFAVRLAYEIVNAIVAGKTGIAVWSVSPDATGYMLLIGLPVEMLFIYSIEGFACVLLPEQKDRKILGFINNRLLYAVFISALLAGADTFLAWSNTIIWVYSWWGSVTSALGMYLPVILLSFYMYDAPESISRNFSYGFIALVMLLMFVLIPIGII